MNANDPLTELKDIHLPEAVSWWPPAMGWWLLLALGLSLFIVCIWWWQRRRKSNAYRRQALQELSKIYSHWLQNNDSYYFIHNVQLLLRRSALAAYPAQDIPALNGDRWAAWLQSSLPTSSAGADFTALGSGLYKAKQNTDNIQTLHQDCRLWLEKHRPKKSRFSND